MNARSRLKAQLPRAPKPGVRGPNHRILATVACGAAAIFVVDGYLAPIATAVAAAAGYVLADRSARSAEQRRLRSRTRQLPFALEAFAACLKTGATVPQALGWAGEAVGGRLGADIGFVAREIVLGTPTQQALQRLEYLPAGPRVTAAMTRSGETGAKLADSLGLLAAELREERQHEAQAAAHKAGVWMVLPLCLCFLPAFVAAGLIPIVVSALTQILHTYLPRKGHRARAQRTTLPTASYTAICSQAPISGRAVAGPSTASPLNHQRQKPCSHTQGN